MRNVLLMLCAAALPFATGPAMRPVYSGPYSATAAQLKIGPDVASAQMACPAQVMDLGGSFMDALMLVRGYRIQGAELQLLDAAGAEVAAFSALSHSLTGVTRDRP